MSETQASQNWSRRGALALPLGVVLLLGVMLIPLPPFVLDLLITGNLMLGIVVLIVGMSIHRPVEFSAFPSLLLVLALFRLCLNVASTRLILLGGETGPGAAGEVIQAFGEFVVGGEPVVGASVFLALVVIQYVVINHGAVRVSEVIARFTLDALPGKQMSVDADLNAGAITDDEARQRRRDIAREAEFYGSMDGAVRFSQRDAVAAIILMAINVIAGLALGVFKFGMPPAQALHLFTMLTIGDGIVAAVPALLVSVAGGIIATRAAAEDQFGQEVTHQILRLQQPLLVAAGLLGVLSVIPGLPKLPFMLLAAACGGLAWRLRHAVKAEAAPVDLPEPATPAEPTVAELLQVDGVAVELGFSLLSLTDDASGGDLIERVRTVRRQVAEELGLLVPPVRIRDRVELPAQEYRIRVHEAIAGRGQLLPRSVMAILPGEDVEVPSGVPTRDPTFGLPARWLRAEDRDRAMAAGCTVVDPPVVLATHLGQVLRREAPRLLDARATREIVETAREITGEEVVPKLLSLGTVQLVLRGLLGEGIGLRDAATIFDALALAAEHTKDPELLIEQVRIALGPATCSRFLGADGRLKVFSLSPELEERLRLEQPDGSIGPELTLAVAEGLREAFSSVPDEGDRVLLTSSAVRRPVRRIVDRVLPSAVVLSHAELPDATPLVRLGVVQ